MLAEPTFNPREARERTLEVSKCKPESSKITRQECGIESLGRNVGFMTRCSSQFIVYTATRGPALMGCV